MWGRVDEDWEDVEEEQSLTMFKFGGGDNSRSLEVVIFPAMMGNQRVRLRFDVLKRNIPLLINSKTQLLARTIIDTGAAKVTIAGETMKLLRRQGLKGISIAERDNVTNKEEQGEVKREGLDKNADRAKDQYKEQIGSEEEKEAIENPQDDEITPPDDESNEND